MVDYTLVSTAAVLRDWYTPDDIPVLDVEHQFLADIADSMYNAGIKPEMFHANYKELYDEYGKEYFDKVLKDMKALDSQIINQKDAKNLLYSYSDKLGYPREYRYGGKTAFSQKDHKIRTLPKDW